MHLKWLRATENANPLLLAVLKPPNGLKNCVEDGQRQSARGGKAVMSWSWTPARYANVRFCRRYCHKTEIDLSQSCHPGCLNVAILSLKRHLSAHERPSILDRLSAVAAAGLELSYGPTQILEGIDFSLEKGKTLALLGPSGCGKTTLLRLVAGLLAPTKGAVSIAGTIVADGATGAFVRPGEARARHGLPGLCALAASDGRRQRLLSA